MKRIVLTLALMLVFVGCDDILPTEADFTADAPTEGVVLLGKTAAQKDRTCSIPSNREKPKCVTWCNDPESNCDGDDPPPPPADDPVASFNYSVLDLLVSFSNTSDNADSYQWDFGDGSTSTEFAPVYEYASAGSYTVTLIAFQDDGDFDEFSTTVNVSDSPPPPPPPGDYNFARNTMLDVVGAWPLTAGFDLIDPGDVVCFTGYSNSRDHANRFINSGHGDFTGATFINGALGSNALENWASNPSLLDRCGSQPVDLVFAQISSQSQTLADSSDVADAIWNNLPVLYNNIRSKWPNAIIAFNVGEPAHWVSESKRWGIREPSRWFHGPVVLNVIDVLRETDPLVVHGVYLWNAEGVPNLTVEFTRDDYRDGATPGDNQHTNTDGSEKAAGAYAIFLDRNDGE